MILFGVSVLDSEMFCEFRANNPADVKKETGRITNDGLISRSAHPLPHTEEGTRRSEDYEEANEPTVIWHQ